MFQMCTSNNLGVDHITETTMLPNCTDKLINNVHVIYILCIVLHCKHICKIRPPKLYAGEATTVDYLRCGASIINEHTGILLSIVLINFMELYWILKSQ